MLKPSLTGKILMVKTFIDKKNMTVNHHKEHQMTQYALDRCF